MKRHDSRVTLVATSQAKPDLDWKVSAGSTRLAFVGSLTALRLALESAVGDFGLDIERAIVDRVGGAEEFLELLAGVPGEFGGDLLLVRNDGGGYLSAAGRGGDRVLYALTLRDVRFYLEAQDLVTGRGLVREERMTA